MLTQLSWRHVSHAVFVLQMDLGSVYFPQNPVISPPAPVTIGPFDSKVHGVRCDDIIVLYRMTFCIKNLHYDGQAPGGVKQAEEYPKTSSISHTKSQDLNVSCIILQLSSLHPLKPGVKLRRKM